MMRRAWYGCVAVALLLGAAGRAEAQGAPAADSAALSLEDAVARALEESEEIRLARSSVAVARSQVTAARAQALPQLNASLGYTRTLASVFSGAAQPALPDSLRFDPDPSRPLEERVAYLEDRVPTAALGSIGGLFGNLPFGRENAYTASLSGSQLLYSGGRVGAAMEIARNYRASAEATLLRESAQLQLQVRGAYYRALLATEMARIAEAALEQAESFLEQERVRLRAGQASDLEVMRAEVSRDNLRPQLVQATSAAELAMLDLKRLVNVPVDRPLRLTTPLEAPAPDDTAAVLPSPELLRAQEAQIAAATYQVEITDDQVRVARGAFLPSVSLQSAYARQLYPSRTFAVDEPWQSDWTVSLNVSVPVFSGLRRSAELQQARLQNERAELQLTQLREALQLQYERARAEKQRALVTIQARERTVEVAQRVHDLTVLRYERGLATQLEVSDARLALLQARTNLAQAIADYHTADTGAAASVAAS